jgi:hypothetical protein
MCQAAHVSDAELAGWLFVIAAALVASAYLTWSPRLRRRRAEVRATLREMAVTIEAGCHDNTSDGLHHVPV